MSGHKSAHGEVCGEGHPKLGGEAPELPGAEAVGGTDKLGQLIEAHRRAFGRFHESVTVENVLDGALRDHGTDDTLAALHEAAESAAAQLMTAEADALRNLVEYRPRSFAEAQRAAAYITTVPDLNSGTVDLVTFVRSLAAVDG